MALFLALVPAGVARAQPPDPAALVNPFIGTTGGAGDFPGADAPFGMVQWSPDTTPRPHGGGYDYRSSVITGFSLTHVSGTGCRAAGDVPMLPTVGPVDPAATGSFSHANESADAGYYSVTLDNGIRTELTATARSGMARFTFPPAQQANLIVKLAGSQTAVLASSFTLLGDTEIAGSVTTGHFCNAKNTYTVYFDIVFDRPFVVAGETSSAPSLTFDTSGGVVVQAKAGLSYVSIANAAANRAAENPGWSFDATRQATHSAWNALLGRIRVGGSTATHRQIFYTALYHSLLHPNVFSDGNGQYIGFDGAVHTAGPGQSAQYANFSGWDIYRGQAQLTALLAPARAGDMAQSMVNDFAQGGVLPKWSFANSETYTMVGDPADAIIAGYYAFGARGFDTAAALNAMVQQAGTPNKARPGQNYLDSPGYLPADGSYGCCNHLGSVATTLEYATADFALASFAGALGARAIHDRFLARAQNWRNVLNTETGFMQPRLANGAWVSGFDPTSQRGFVEGTSWQYTGMVPFNVRGLADAKGGNAAYGSYLDSVLGNPSATGGNVADLRNEPSLGLPWQYDYVGQPWKTQLVVRRVQNRLWRNTPDGLPGNDDLGTMSAWYVWSALGMYPETPGTAYLALGSPLFTTAIVTLPGRRSLTISAPGAADAAPFVQSLKLDGRSWNNAYLPPSVVAKGGRLSYVLGRRANRSWATGPTSAPPSFAPPP